MTVGDRWLCPVCWKSNSPKVDACWHCRTERAVEATQVERRRAEVAEQAHRPEAVPDIVVALPVVVFRSYAKAWFRGGLGLLAVPILMGLAGVPDLGALGLSVGLAVGLVVFGFLAGEVADGMRDREAWAFAVGIGLAVVGAIGSVLAFETFAPGLVSPTAVRWGSLIVFGGAGLAAAAGLVLMVVRGDRPSMAAPVSSPRQEEHPS
jgi:hypothetical protein